MAFCSFDCSFVNLIELLLRGPNIVIYKIPVNVFPAFSEYNTYKEVRYGHSQWIKTLSSQS